MENTLTTPRLKLTLITSAERGSEEFKWLHELRSNKQTQAWSIFPPSQTLSDTETAIRPFLPEAPPATQPNSDTTQKSYKIAYAVHEIQSSSETRFIGLVTLVSLTPGRYLPLPSHLVVPTATSPSEIPTPPLIVELAYTLLPHAWGKGYATESLSAVLSACRSPTNESFWQPWERVWMRVIVNGRNPASLRVMRKLRGEGVVERGVYEWKGEKIFIGGEWRTEDDLNIFGGWLRD